MLIRAIAIVVGLGLVIVSAGLAWENFQAPGEVNVVIVTFSSLGLGLGAVLLWWGGVYLREQSKKID